MPSLVGSEMCIRDSNEAADLLAKRGADPLSGSPPHTVLPAFGVARKKIASLCLSLWRREWSTYPGGRMTKHFLPGPNLTQVSPLIQLDRVSLSQCIGFLTGHMTLDTTTACATQTSATPAVSAGEGRRHHPTSMQNTLASLPHVSTSLAPTFLSLIHI